MRNKIRKFFFFLLIIWQLFIWFQFVPSDYSDPWTDPYLGPGAGLAPGFYYMLGIPVGVLGIFLSVFVIRKKLEMAKSEKIIVWILFIISVCTAIPPLFTIARYIFYPLVNWLDRL